MLPSRLDATLQARMRGHLAALERRSVCDPDLQRAAVALVLVTDELERPCVLLTRRLSRLRAHAGQFALPGGRIDAGETPEQAARRELEEEVGVAVGEQAVLGLLDDFATRSGYAITPVVLWAQGTRELSPSPHEVAIVYRVPLAQLYGPGVPQLSYIPESERPLLSIPLLGTQIHAPTAAMLYQLREVALEGRDTRVGHYEQPLFAWS